MNRLFFELAAISAATIILGLAIGYLICTVYDIIKTKLSAREENKKWD
jgi:uncharacterized membrane protein YciS (DUF1049 family)